ncbi:MAG TPA: amino acid adenylation domain-containing protein, partial [Ktedonobacteraceae bacterium]|nr:amino acid adenylation domain-containing protein [Ktedonobacteraceae bacterium]
LFMALLTVFQVVLARYSRQEDIVVGTPIAGRTRPELEALVGCFVNTLPLRAKLHDNPQFIELLQRTKTTALDAYTYQHVPFEKIVDILRPVRDTSYSPLIQVLFSVQNLPSIDFNLPDLHVSLLPEEVSMSKFDITLDIMEEAGCLKGTFEYNTDLFDEETIVNIGKCYVQLVEALVTDPTQRIGFIPLTTEGEQQKLFSVWCNETPFAEQGACIHELFEQRTAKTPDTVALVFEDQHITYREVDRRSTQLAQYLQSLGIGPERIVGLYVSHSPEMIIGMLGILKAGGGYLPLDPAYPAERLAYMLADANATLLLTQASLRLADWIPQELNVVCLDADWQSIASTALVPLAKRVTPENVALILYTSGTTGRPKGTLMLHRGLVNLTVSAAQEFGLTPNDRTLLFASPSFDLLLEQFYPFMYAGCCMVINSDGRAPSLIELSDCTAQQNLTVLDLPSVYWQAWVTELQSSGEKVPSVLRAIILGGEKTLPEHTAKWQAITANRVQLINTYAPTEATVTSTIFRPDPAMKITTNFVSLGTPITNTQLYVLDQHLNLVARGIPGELYIGGAGLVRGYLNRPELTAERFVPNPFATKPGDRLYRTGDLVRYVSDTMLEFLGRTDLQAKLHGFRIELSEIEIVLEQHPSVRDIALRVYRPEPEKAQLIAYIVERQHAEGGEERLEASHLQRYLREQLPEYMIPGQFIFLEEIPLTVNGKVDYSRLPLPTVSLSRSLQPSILPESESEQIIAAIWCQALGL